MGSVVVVSAEIHLAEYGRGHRLCGSTSTPLNKGIGNVSQCSALVHNIELGLIRLLVLERWSTSPSIGSGNVSFSLYRTIFPSTGVGVSFASEQRYESSMKLARMLSDHA